MSATNNVAIVVGFVFGTETKTINYVLETEEKRISFTFLMAVTHTGQWSAG